MPDKPAKAIFDENTELTAQLTYDGAFRYAETLEMKLLCHKILNNQEVQFRILAGVAKLKHLHHKKGTYQSWNPLDVGTFEIMQDIE